MVSPSKVLEQRSTQQGVELSFAWVKIAGCDLLPSRAPTTSWSSEGGKAKHEVVVRLEQLAASCPTPWRVRRRLTAILHNLPDIMRAKGLDQPAGTSRLFARHGKYALLCHYKIKRSGALPRSHHFRGPFSFRGGALGPQERRWPYELNLQANTTGIRH